MVTPTNHVIAGPNLHCVEPLALWRFSQDLSANYMYRPKKSYDLSAGPLAGTASYYGCSAVLFSLRSFEPLFFDLLFYIQRHGSLSTLSLDSKGPKANYVKFADVETWHIWLCCKHFFVCSLMT